MHLHVDLNWPQQSLGWVWFVTDQWSGLGWVKLIKCFRSGLADRRITLGMSVDPRPIETGWTLFYSTVQFGFLFLNSFSKSFFLCFSLIYKSLDNKW